MIYQQDHTGVDINAVPAVFKPTVGPFKLTYLEKVFGTDPGNDILPLTATAELGEFFAGIQSTAGSYELA